MSAPDPDAQTTPVLRHAGTAAAIALALGAAAFVLLIWGFVRDPQRVYHSYLAAYAFALSVVLGSIAFVMTAHAANTTWPVAVRRLAEAVAPGMPALTVLFIPIVIGIRPLYPWARVNEFEPRVQEMLVHRMGYMNPGFFTLRAGAYLVLWSAFALALRNLSLAMEHGADAERCSHKLRVISYAGLPIMAFSVGVSGFEWLMSLSPEFASTMYGALWIAVCLFSGVACVIVLTGLAQRSSVRLPAPSAPHYSALGRLLLAFLVFLGYTVFFQYLLVWIGNIPDEAKWFLERGRGLYFASAMFLIFGHFTLPFLLLLSFRLKRRIAALSWVGWWCLASSYIHVHWLVTASSREPGASWFDLVALVAVLATTASVCLWFQRGKSLAPTFDPRYLETFSYESR